MRRRGILLVGVLLGMGVVSCEKQCRCTTITVNKDESFYEKEEIRKMVYGKCSQESDTYIYVVDQDTLTTHIVCSDD